MKEKNEDIKTAKRELEYLIWIMEEKIRRTNEEELKILLENQLKLWKNRLKKN